MSDTQVVVVNQTQRIIVDAPSRSATVVLAGPVGPPGEVTSAELSMVLGMISTLQSEVADLQIRVTELETP